MDTLVVIIIRVNYRQFACFGFWGFFGWCDRVVEFIIGIVHRFLIQHCLINIESEFGRSV